MSQSTNIVVSLNNREYPVTPGFTLDEFVDSLRATFPDATNAQLIDDGIKEGVEHYTLKPNRGKHG